MTDRERIDAAIARFPKYFGLRAFPGAIFRIGSRESFVDDNGNVKLYTQRFHGTAWLDFAKGTEPELRSQITDAPADLLAALEAHHA